MFNTGLAYCTHWQSVWLQLTDSFSIITAEGAFWMFVLIYRMEKVIQYFDCTLLCKKNRFFMEAYLGPIMCRLAKLLPIRYYWKLVMEVPDAADALVGWHTTHHQLNDAQSSTTTFVKSLFHSSYHISFSYKGSRSYFLSFSWNQYYLEMSYT